MNCFGSNGLKGTGGGRSARPFGG